MQEALMQEVNLTGADAMIDFGRSFSRTLKPGDCVWLTGDLGAGKTTLVKGILQGLGHRGAVTSPTYTLVEPYQAEDLDVLHMDLYRLESAEELEMLGIREQFGESMLLVEWPENGTGYLPPWDWCIHIDYVSADSRKVRIECRQ